MGLDDLKPFNPKEKIIEYLLEAENTAKRLIDMTCTGFANETASESPAPGGGSIAAYIGSLGAALGTMVANLSSHKPGWDEKWKKYSNWAEKGQQLKDELLYLVDEDTQAFNKIMEAFGLPKKTDAEKVARKQAIEDATKYAIEVPFKTLEKSFEVFELCQAMIEIGNPNSVTDAGVGVLCARTAVIGAYFNVKINAAGLNDKAYAEAMVAKAAEYVTRAKAIETRLIKKTEAKIQ